MTHGEIFAHVEVDMESTDENVLVMMQYVKKCIDGVIIITHSMDTVKHINTKYSIISIIKEF